MPVNFVRRTYDAWIAQNRARFTHPPRVTLSRRDFFELTFEGVTPLLT